jgi:hypothetical protein
VWTACLAPFAGFCAIENIKILAMSPEFFASAPFDVPFEEKALEIAKSHLVRFTSLRKILILDFERDRGCCAGTPFPTNEHKKAVRYEEENKVYTSNGVVKYEDTEAAKSVRSGFIFDEAYEDALDGFKQELGNFERLSVSEQEMGREVLKRLAITIMRSPIR